MESKKNNFAFIDSQNLNLGVQDLGWKLDFAKFRVYLKDKYKAEKAFLFIGYIEGNVSLYKRLQEQGYICIFKPTLEYKDRSTKGNCDAELVLQTMIELNNFNLAIIVSGDGDFHCLVTYLIEQGKLLSVIVPNEKKFSALYKQKAIIPFLRSINNLKEKLIYKKRPHKD